ncbi:olfactory receptor 7E178-like [Castor canadensis]|uniref:Olfactory receptor 7E178-like n=1 Tax=Castor canadensis TaxID=51338 RepID=A0A8B7WIH5_CASCN
MEPENLTCIWEFFLLGLSENAELQPIHFGLFLSIYLITVLGNLLIILAISCDSYLHTPMYFFLFNLSLADVGFISTTVPKMLANIHTHTNSITHRGCLTQVFFFMLFGCLDNLLLTVMAYDRFVTICHPLHYFIIMNPRLCVFLVVMSYFISLLDSQVHCLVVSQLTFCKVVEIPHFFCDTAELVNLACSDTYSNNALIYIVIVIFAGVPVIGILYSYTRIALSILRVPSVCGKYKAFSTCGSHLSVVCLFYGTGFGVYLSSAVSHSPRKGAMVSVMYTMITPMLNPFIYSLRNRDIKRNLMKWFRKIMYFSTLAVTFGS